MLNHGGRIVEGTGDGVLIEFPSAVEAVRAGIETQRLMAERNAALARDRRMEYRIGVNLGDVIVDDDGDVYGDGVNIAASRPDTTASDFVRNIIWRDQRHVELYRDGLVKAGLPV